MLPGYPKIQRLRAQRNAAEVKARASQLSPFLKDVESHIQFEGSGSYILRYDNTVGDAPSEVVSAELTTRILPVEEFTKDYLYKQLHEAAEQFASGMSKQFIKMIDKTTAETGNVIDAKGKGFSEEMFLQMIEKMDHSFGPDGTWHAPTAVVGSDVYAAVQALAARSEEENAAMDAKLKAILEKKRDEYNRREADRILAG